MPESLLDTGELKLALHFLKMYRLFLLSDYHNLHHFPDAKVSLPVFTYFISEIYAGNIY